MPHPLPTGPGVSDHVASPYRIVTSEEQLHDRIACLESRLVHAAPPPDVSELVKRIAELESQLHATEHWCQDLGKRIAKLEGQSGRP